MTGLLSMVQVGGGDDIFLGLEILGRAGLELCWSCIMLCIILLCIGNHWVWLPGLVVELHDIHHLHARCKVTMVLVVHIVLRHHVWVYDFHSEISQTVKTSSKLLFNDYAIQD
eukprot:TRINITY_DN22478_c0_g1_i1.p1 TRINITY_DN22478_c0_g1~~TRINITY_DN22478_c0_g1_i1.p1  ORF type:complete len:113 (+),score=2.17 TRINITY_DN22478_c0_g1_i1:232-570(+)